MPLARIVIEQVQDGGWVAEVEAAAVAERCRLVRGATLDEICERIKVAHRGLTEPRPKT